MAKSTILVTGATGNTGSGIVQTLAAQGRSVRALVRNPEKASALKEAGAEVAAGDLDDPTTLKPAIFDEVTTVYLVTWNGPTAADQVHNFMDALKASGAQPRIVRGSAYGSPKSRIIQDIQKMDDEVKDSGLPWTILQPTFFMQNLMMTIPTVRGQGVVYSDWAEGKAGMIDVRDIVDSAVGTINTTDGSLDGESLVLTGPAPVGFDDVASELSAALGKPVAYVPVPHEAAFQSMVGMGLPEWIAQGFVELNEGFANGYADLATDNVQKLSGHAPHSLHDFICEMRGAWQG